MQQRVGYITAMRIVKAYTAKFVPHLYHISYCTVNDDHICSIHDILAYMGHNVSTVQLVQNVRTICIWCAARICSRLYQL